MKGFAFALFMVLGFSLSAQGNLQFNRALLLEPTVSIVNFAPTNVADSVYTVPAGKVWKIESTSTSLTFNDNGIQFTLPDINVNLYLNRKPLYLGYASGSQLWSQVNYPIWLPAGTYTFRLEGAYNSSGASNIKGNAFISVIEFNIVP